MCRFINTRFIEFAAGTYTVVATDENGCSVTTTVEITEAEEMAITETHSDYTGYGVSCNGATDGSIDVTVTGGMAFTLISGQMEQRQKMLLT